ncbi:tyrosine-type recombinase/integrase [Rhodanobacter sp. FW106-PBR-R2A-1-13]|uniref:tyrosine-type recombinase/integrase n=1 Tax=Rhodanobacter sp. FW106-PBR-R2A-1-13 TaxID=3454845 RepID=UPI0034E38CFC
MGASRRHLGAMPMRPVASYGRMGMRRPAGERSGEAPTLDNVAHSAETDGREPFIELLRSKLSTECSEAWIRRCVSTLDAVGGPANVAAYLGVLYALRNLLGWGRRSRWLKPLPDWEFVDAIYRACGWIHSEFESLMASAGDMTPQFAKPGYATLFGEVKRHGRICDVVVLMTLVGHAEALGGVGVTQAHIDDLVDVAGRADAASLEFLRTLRGYRGYWGGAGRFQLDAWQPDRLSGAWGRFARNLESDLPEATREAIRVAGALIATLLELASQKPEEQASGHEAKASTHPKSTAHARRRGRVRLLPDGTELFGLRMAMVPRPESPTEPAQPEDRAVVEFTLEHLGNIPDECGRSTRDWAAYVTARQRDAIDWVLVPAQRDALLAAEAQLVVAELLSDAKAAEASGDHARLATNLMLLLVALRALSTQEVRRVRYASLNDALTMRDGTVVTPDGYVVCTVPMPPERHRPAPDAEGLHEVGQRLALRLPEAVQGLLQAWAAAARLDAGSGDALLFGPGAGIPAKSISRRDDVIRDRTGVQRFNAGRLGNTLPLVLMAATHDLSVVQMATGDAQGLSLVGCAYYSPRVSQLQAAFDEGIEAMGFTCGPPEAIGNATRVGSALCLRDAVVRDRVAQLGQGLNYLTRRKGAPTPSQLIDGHHRMALYTGRLLEACLATRYHRTVGDMTLADVALDPGWIILADKRTDAAHAARPVVVSSLAVAQIRAFASHLEALSRHPEIPPAVRQAMREALGGTRPLIFFVDGDRTMAWDTEALRRFDPGWSWPSNTMRHRAATCLREQGCPGDFVAAQLGHVELGHVLGLDSPTPPDRFHEAVSRATDAYATADGWTVQRGYGSGAWTERVPLPAYREMERIRAALDQREKQYLGGRRPSGEPEEKELADALRRTIADRLEARAADVVAVDGVRHLDHAFTVALRKDVALDHRDDPARVEWALGQLRDLMLAGERQQRWLCDDRRKVVRILVEPSPVEVGMIDAYRAYRAVRAWYAQALPAGIGSGGEATLWCWLALGLVLDEGLTDRHDVQAILHGLGNARLANKRRGALVVPLSEADMGIAQATILHGRCALLAARVHHQGGDLPDDVRLWRALDDWLHQVLPQHLKPHGVTLLTWLVELTRLASRLALPGLFRAVRQRALATTSLPVDRMARLLDERPPPAPTVLPVFELGAPDAEEAPTPEAPTRQWMAEVEQELRTVLRKMTLQEYHLKYGVAPEKSSVREDKARRLRELLEDDRLIDETAQLVVGYALKLLEQGTPHKSRLADSTIYMYVCDVAAAFTGLGEALPRAGLMDLPAKDLERLYRGVVDAAKNPRLSDQLRYFQIWLEEVRTMPHVSGSAVFRGPKRSKRVEVDLVTEREYHAALVLLARALDIHREDRWLAWQLRAARVATILMFRGDLRLGEVMGRKYSDLTIVGKQAIIDIHDTVFGPLKTRNAYRVVVLETLPDAERCVLETWLDDAWLPDKRKHRDRGSPLLPDRPFVGLPVSRQHIETIIGTVLGAVTGNPLARPHWLRHSAASYRLLWTLGTPLLGEVACDRSGSLPRRADVVRMKARIGHGSISTTMSTYVHTVPVLSLSPDSWGKAYDGEALARIAGIGHGLLRRKRADLVKRGRPADELAALLMRRYVRPLEPTDPRRAADPRQIPASSQSEVVRQEGFRRRLRGGRLVVESDHPLPLGISMPLLRTRKDGNGLCIDFRYQGVQCCEPIPFADTPADRPLAEAFLRRVSLALQAGDFRYSDYFPGSHRARQFDDRPTPRGTMPFRDFVPVWISDMTPQWSAIHLRTVREVVNKHLLPAFGDSPLNAIRRADVLAFRSALAQLPGYRGTLTPSRINKVMCFLRQILKEAAGRFDFQHPFHEIKPLRMKRSDVRPFSLEDTHALVQAIDPHYRNYLVTRFFTGMRSGEINGLRWVNVDRQRGLILVRETLVTGKLEEGTKTERSTRDIPMLPVVREAVEAQWECHDPSCPWVFPTPNGYPIDAKNFNNRVWKPLLARLGLPPRRPYQTRHTAATLMLAAGENPEWVAYVLGHTNLQMLFRVYSRFIPNLTRQDGSAMASLLQRQWGQGGEPYGP